eukprot:1177387-Prorocentrum_minimum.AAC.7
MQHEVDAELSLLLVLGDPVDSLGPVDDGLEVHRVTSRLLDTDIKPSLRHSATGELNSPPKYLRAPKKCPS